MPSLYYKASNEIVCANGNKFASNIGSSLSLMGDAYYSEHAI